MPLVNPMLKIHCPYCRVPFHPGDCAVCSTLNFGPPTAGMPSGLTPLILRKAPTPGTFEYFRSRTWIEELSGPEFVNEMARRQCPHCHRMLFEGVEMCDNIIIAIVGDTFSSKTHYIAALVEQLRRGVLIQNGNGLVELVPLNEETISMYKDKYYDPIFRDRTAVAASQRGTFDMTTGRPIRSEPLVYQLKLQDNSTHTNNMINLLFYDISGEDLASNQSLVQYGEHVLRADGIIYLADPFAMTNMRQKIPQPLQPSSISGRRAEEVLSNIVHRLGVYQKIGSGTIHTPTAIAIAKSDLLQYAIPKNAYAKFLLMYRPYYDGKAHMETIEEIDKEVRFLLQQFSEFPLLQLSRRFNQVCFFAIAATGNAPDNTGKYTNIEPHRCLDPLIWLLWKRGFLPAVQ